MGAADYMTDLTCTFSRRGGIIKWHEGTENEPTLDDGGNEWRVGNHICNHQIVNVRLNERLIITKPSEIRKT